MISGGCGSYSDLKLALINEHVDSICIGNLAIFKKKNEGILPLGISYNKFLKQIQYAP